MYHYFCKVIYSLHADSVNFIAVVVIWWFFSKVTFQEKIFQEHYQSAEWMSIPSTPLQSNMLIIGDDYFLPRKQNKRKTTTKNKKTNKNKHNKQTKKSDYTDKKKKQQNIAKLKKAQFGWMQ